MDQHALDLDLDHDHRLAVQAVRATPYAVPEVVMRGGRYTAAALLQALPDRRRTPSVVRDLIARGALWVNEQRLTTPESPVDLVNGDIVRVGWSLWLRIHVPPGQNTSSTPAGASER